jgi:hypothetical protein
MRRYFLLLLPLVLFSTSLLFQRCKKETFITDNSAKLEFSTDTVFFDTVFTTLGSTTQYLRVYNPHDKSIKISSIDLEAGNNSQYRINVDGADGIHHENIEILPNDSIYIFVEVTIDPNNTATPFVVEDRIKFSTNGNEQHVQLSSWGQNAYFHGGLGSVILADCNAVWNNDRPHVIYGVLFIDEGCDLTINAGTQVYVHAKSGIYVNGGTIHVNGSLNNEVCFQGDRLEQSFQDEPGQWGIQFDFPVTGGGTDQIVSFLKGGIWINSSPGSEVDYAIIKNGNIGIWVDSTGVDYFGNQFSVSVSNTKILNMASHGMITQNATLKACNMQISNCGQTCAYLSIGGRYQVDNCTFANYWSGGNRTDPAFALTNFYVSVDDDTIVYPIINTHINNCIMYGNNALLTDFSEFIVGMKNDAAQQYDFKYCLVDTDQDVDDDGNHYQSMKNGQAPLLCDPAEEDCRLLSSSQGNALMSGSFFSTTPVLDIFGLNNGNSYKGCFVYDPSNSCN